MSNYVSGILIIVIKKRSGVTKFVWNYCVSNFAIPGLHPPQGRALILKGNYLMRDF